MRFDGTTGTYDGTSQEDRLTPALEEGFVLVDERRCEDLLAMAVDHARLLTFYNAHNEPEGDWEAFVTTDEALIMAMILTTDPGKLPAAASGAVTDLQRPELATREAGWLPMPAYVLAQHVNMWFTTLHAIDSEAGRTLWQKIDEVIYEKLGPELVALGRFVGQHSAPAEERLRHAFHSAWFRREGETPQVPSLVADDEARERFLKTNLQAFANAVAFIKTWAARLLPASLQSQRHGAATGLYIAFAQLFQKAQERLNRFTQRHLHFYYHDVLRIHPLPSIPDHTYLLFQPDPGKTVLVKAGTEFTARVGAPQHDVTYTADQDLLVHGAQVRALYTLHLARDPFTAPEHALHFFSGAHVHALPVPQGSAPVHEQHVPAWPVFGAVKSHEEPHVFPDADMGFALASPVLHLAEGERTLTVTLRFDYAHVTEVSTLDTFLETLTDMMQAGHAECADLLGKWRDGLSAEHARILQAYKLETFFKVFRHMFTIALTTAQGWYEVAEYFPVARVVDATYNADCLAFRIHLAPEVPAIVPYVAAVHGGRYDTDLPVVRFVINPRAYVYPYSLLQGMLLHEVHIDVDVQGVRNVLLYNDLGPLNPASPFQPFGPLPSVGASFIVGNAEAAQKQLTAFAVEVEWGDLPAGSGGWRDHYQAYDRPFDSALFEARVTVLRDGRWLPAEAAQQPAITLFRAIDRDATREENARLTAHRWTLTPNVTRLLKPLQRFSKAGEFGYTALAQGGFVQFTLSRPLYAFGHSNRSATQNLTLAMTSSTGVPCGHGHAPHLTTGPLGPDPTRNPSLH